MAKRTEGTRLSPKLISLAVAACFATGTALANPTGPTVVNGQVTISQSGNLLSITNSPNSIINWQSFSIGSNEITRFLQQSAASAVMNRVTGPGNPSAILGALQSNGRVFLINPSGIVFGAGSQVDVAGLVASSLNLSNADFLAGRLRFTEVPGAGSVVNQGAINAAAGGQVYLVGPSVTNSGIITTPQGEVVLAAGNSVELVNPGTPNLRVEIAASDNEARNLGQIIADSGRVGIYAGLINHSGTIRADSAQVTDDGRIILKATRDVTLEPTSVLSASGATGGEIRVLAEDTVRVDGRLDASAPNGGDGGFIETSGKNRVIVAPGTVVTTNAPFGRSGTWLIDPSDYYIDVEGDISGFDLGNNLATTNVVITSDQGSGSGNGDIFVNDSVSWSSSNGLTLTARRNVEVNSSIGNSGAGDISLFAGWDGASPTSPVVQQGVGNIAVTANVSTRGNVRFRAGHDITVTSSSVTVNTTANDDHAIAFHAGNQIRLNAATVSVQTDDVGAATINFTAGAGGIVLQNSATVRATGGNTDEGGPGGPGTVDMTASGPIQLFDSTILAEGGDGSGAPGGNATIRLNTGNHFLLDNSHLIADGGYGGSSAGGIGGSATVQVIASGNIDVNNSYGIHATGSWGQDGGGSGDIALSAGGNINVQHSFIGAEGSAGGLARVTIGANGDIMVGNDSKVLAWGGSATAPSDGTPAQVSMIGRSVLIDGFSGIGAAGGAGDSNGGAGSVNIIAAAGPLTIDGAEGIGAVGGRGQNRGGDAATTLSAMGPVSINNTNSYISFPGGSGTGVFAGGGMGYVEGGDASTGITGQTITQTVSHVEALGGTGGDLSGSGVVAMTATGGDLLISGASPAINPPPEAGFPDNPDNTVVARGGFGENIGSTAGGSEVFLAAAGQVRVTNEGIESVGGAGEARGGDASLTLLGGRGIFITDSHVYAEGGFSDRQGGRADTRLIANGNIEVRGTPGLSATVIARGGRVFFTDGLPGAAGVVMSLAGPDSTVIIDNDSVQAFGPDAVINLTFTDRVDGGFSVNGVDGAITGGTGSNPPFGFFVNGIPAIPGENFFVFYGGGARSFDAQLISSLSTLEQTLMGGVEEATGLDEDKDKKKKETVCK